MASEAAAAAAAAAHPPPFVRVRLVPCQPAGARLVLAAVEEEARLRLDVQADGTVSVAISLRCWERVIGSAQEPRVRLRLAEREDGTLAATLMLAAEGSPDLDEALLPCSSTGACSSEAAATPATTPSAAAPAGPSPLQLRHVELLQENARLQGLVRQVRGRVDTEKLGANCCYLAAAPSVPQLFYSHTLPIHLPHLPCAPPFPFFRCSVCHN